MATYLEVGLNRQMYFQIYRYISYVYHQLKTMRHGLIRYYFTVIVKITFQFYSLYKFPFFTSYQIVVAYNMEKL